MPSKELRKFCFGSLTFVPPPRTTKPVMTMNSKITSFMAEIRFISLIDQRVERRHMRARKE
jgi:hypothetical protein